MFYYWDVETCFVGFILSLYTLSEDVRRYVFAVSTWYAERFPRGLIRHRGMFYVDAINTTASGGVYYVIYFVFGGICVQKVCYFLRSVVQNVTKLCETANSEVFCRWERSFNQNEVEFVQNHAILYDLKNPEFKNTLTKDLIWNEAGKVLNKVS